MKHSRTANLFAITALAILAASTSIKGYDRSDLLTADDLNQEATDRARGPALSSALDDPRPWATYNQWMCFNAAQARVESIQIRNSSAWKPWPQLEVHTLGQLFEFSPEIDLDLDTLSVIETWTGLAKATREICFYAAFLQYLDLEENNNLPTSLWVLEDIKTENGYWHIADESNK